MNHVGVIEHQLRIIVLARDAAFRRLMISCIGCLVLCALREGKIRGLVLEAHTEPLLLNALMVRSGKSHSLVSIPFEAHGPEALVC